MAPLIEKKRIESLENLCLKTVLSSMIADLYLTQLLKSDLKNSLLLANFRQYDIEKILRQISQRLHILPGILNDQVRQKLIIEFFINNAKSNFNISSNIGVDLLKVLLNDTITSLHLGSRKLPKQVLSIIADKCPNITSLSLIVEDKLILDNSDAESVDSITLTRKRFSLKAPNRRSKTRSEEPSHKRRKLSSANKDETRDEFDLILSSSFKHLTELSLRNGACDQLLKILGQNATQLQKLCINFSYRVTDLGVKEMCLKNPDNHSQRNNKLHEMRVRSFHLNPCCLSLKELEIVGTKITQYGVAFLLKYLPHLESLGDCGTISEALEVLVGNKINKYRSLPAIRSHGARYKLARMKEEKVTSKKFLLLTSLCPDLSELHISHPYREVDLGNSIESLRSSKNVTAQIGHLKHLKTFSIVNVSSGSVCEAIQAVGPQLSSLRVLSKGLDLPIILSNCVNLNSLIIEGTSVLAPYEALETVRSNALKKLEVLKLKSPLPTSYIELILSSSNKLTQIDVNSLAEVNDSEIIRLVNIGHFNQLVSLCVKKASYLTIEAATCLIKKCPKLEELKDLGGWNINSVQYLKLERDVKKMGLKIRVQFDPYSESDDSDRWENSSVTSESVSNMLDAAFRNLLPIMIF